jgi:hypothetical protein
MKNFSISESALLEVQRLLGRTDSQDAVAYLYEHGYAGSSFDDINSQYVEGKLSLENMKSLVTERFAAGSVSFKYGLEIVMTKRTNFQPDDLCQINGVTFAVKKEVAEALWEYCLMFEDGEFFFRGPDGLRHLYWVLRAKLIPDV